MTYNRLLKGLTALVLSAAVVGCTAGQAQAPAVPSQPLAQLVGLEPLAAGFDQPTSIVSAQDGTGRLFVTQKTGLLRILKEGAILPAPFLDLTKSVTTDSERGLLGLAFHPDYATNGRFFVNYTNTSGNTVVSEFHVSQDPNVADAASEKVLLLIEQPYSNHNGGDIVFGPDGYLYIGMGDGGAGGDPEDRAQDLGNLLGKMLRVDVDAPADGEAYGIPADNPFVSEAGAEPEIWAYGLRNPWRFSFDRETGDLWIADVGQNRMEEVNLQAAASKGGENYGWNIMEADTCFDKADPLTPAASCQEDGLTLPVLAYSHDEGSSITGGYVYRGRAVPALMGFYIYGDFGSGTLWAAKADDSAATGYRSEVLLQANFSVVTFGEDDAGELYVADFGGTIYRFSAK